MLQITDQQYKNYAYSLVPGLVRSCLTLVNHPLELLKVNLQTTPFQQGHLRNLVKQIGIMGPSSLYRGYTITLSSMLLKTVYKYPCLILGPGLVQQYLNQQNPILAQIAIAPLIVGIDTFFQNPLRRIKFVAMTNNKSTFSVVRHFMKTKARLWYGSKAYLIKHGAGSGSLILSDAIIRKAFHDRNMEVGYKNPTYIAVMGLNGVVLSVLTTPFDVIATKMGAKNDDKPYRGFLSTVHSLYKSEGLAGFVKGSSIRVFSRTASVIYTGVAISWGRSLQP